MTNPRKTRQFYTYTDRDGRIYTRRVCLVNHGDRIPGHPCLGPNRIAECDGFVNIRELVEHINGSGLQPQTIAFDEIWHQLHAEGEKEWIIANDPRFQKADTGFPGIVARIANPGGKPYRMLDGRRRMWKLQAAGEVTGKFYVVPEDTVLEHFWMVMSRQQLARQMAGAGS